MSPSTHSTSGASAASTGSISPRPNAPYSSWICSRLGTWGTLGPRCRFAREATVRAATRCERHLAEWRPRKALQALEQLVLEALVMDARSWLRSALVVPVAAGRARLRIVARGEPLL